MKAANIRTPDQERDNMIVLKRMSRIVGLCCALVAGCSTFDGPEFERIPADKVLARIELLDRAVLIAVGDTLDLVATATTANKQPMSLSDGNAVWLSQDSSVFTVTQTGRIVARKASSLSVNVVVKFTYDLVTRTDTVPVFVTTTRINATTGKLVALDSTRIGGNLNGFFGFPRVRLDLYRGDTVVSRGASIALTKPHAITLEYLPGTDTAVGNVYLVKNTGNLLGQFWILGRLNLYGTRISDSVSFVGTYPVGTVLVIFKDFTTNALGGGMLPSAPPLLLEPCGYLFVLNFTGSLLDFVFSDSAASPSGCDNTNVPSGPLSQVGGNVLAPVGGVLRRSNSRGEIAMWLRDPATGDSLQFQYRVFYREGK